MVMERRGDVGDVALLKVHYFGEELLRIVIFAI